MKRKGMIAGGIALAIIGQGAGTSSAQTEAEPVNELNELRVEVGGLRNYRGQVLIYLWRESKEKLQYPEPARVQARDEDNGSEPCDFPRVSLCRRVVKHLNALVVTHTFANLPAGEYAVMAVHDENSNYILDTGIFHRALEGRSYSNIVPEDLGLLGVPVTWSRARFTVKGPKTVALSLRYPPRL